MPPIKKFDKEQIINLALDVAKNEGLDSVNARRIAKELNSSVQPIFHNFKNMEELKDTVYKRSYDLYLSYMLRGKGEEKYYKQMGMNYISFARDYPEFFKMIFMQKTNLAADDFIVYDNGGDDVIKAGQILTGFDYQEQIKFHKKVWIFTHGIACLVATNTIKFSEDEISDLLGNTVLEMLEGYKKKGKK